MKTLIILLLFCLPLFAFCQWSDDFSSGNLDLWSGDVDAFIVNPDKQLNLNASTAGEKFIYREFINQSNLEWNFFEELQFAPSSSNKLRVYLKIDKPDLLDFQGYFIEIGENGNSDNWKFYVKHNMKNILLGQGEISKLAGDPSKAYFKCSKKNDSIWVVKVDYETGVNFVEQIEIKDSLNLQFSNSYFGLHCFFTVTRINKFIFDDIAVDLPIVDTLSPTIIFAKAENSKNLFLQFDEKIDTNSAKNVLNYSESKLGIPNSIQVISQNEIRLSFSQNMISDSSYSISYFNIQDLNANLIKQVKTINFIAHFLSGPKLKDLVISEFMYDPDPAVSLPNAEYIELYNNSLGTIDLDGIKISDGNTISTSIRNYLLNTNQFLILCATKDTNLFKPFGKVYGISNLPSLNNDGDFIILYNREDQIIDQLQYQTDWHTEKTKKDGGYSLELQFPNRACQGKLAWATSLNPEGGTPGKINSLWNKEPDTILPKIISAIPLSQWEIQLSFDDNLDENIMKDQNNYIIDPLKTIANIDVVLPGKSEFILLLNEPLEKGISYNLRIKTIRDCSGNESKDLNINFEIPSQAQEGQLLFNEILSNPITGGVDYIEIYNNSDLLLTTQYLYINNSVKDNNWISINTVKSVPKKSYFVLTTNPETVIQQYPLHASLNIFNATIPSIDDDQGKLKLATFQKGQFVIIDSINFTADWHNPLIVNQSGVSLEKINPSFISNNKGYWTSASKQNYYGTPGLINSQFIDTSKEKSNSLPFTLASIVISPNQDGNNDQLVIYLNLDKPGYKANIKVFDLSGIQIYSLSQNIVGTNDILTWNVLDREQRLLSNGNYILNLEFVHPDGNVLHNKQRIVVDTQK
ncbi:MAG: lamin tail domain-containing protein [Saprospiraceae bacterium]